MATLKTKDRLAQDLEAAGAPEWMVTKARHGEYDDYESDSPTPINDLVKACIATGRLQLQTIAVAAKNGAYDGTQAEAKAWMVQEGYGLLHGKETP